MKKTCTTSGKKIAVRVYRITAIVSLIIAFAVSAAHAQGSVEVRGEVTDAAGNPLPGSIIVEKGTTNGTTTDAAGFYSLKVGSDDAVLVFSYMGMSEVEEVVEGRSTINIRMKGDTEMLDDIIVIGYGTVRKSDLTGSVSSIGGESLSNRVITSLEDAMRGQAAGVSIIQNDGTPGAAYSMRIRGASSVNASSTPIYVIDGVIIEDAEDLNPGDVESIEILKDASATAIYGSRGANGVIIVTTKKGLRTDSQPTIEFYANAGVQSPVRNYDMMNSMEYARARYQSIWEYSKSPAAAWLGNANYDYFRDGSDNNAGWWRASNNPALTANAIYKDWQSYANGIDTDWQDEMFRNAAFQEYRISVRGGSEKSAYSVMGGYLNQKGIVVFSGFERFTGRINFDQQLRERLKLTSSLSLSHSYQNGLATGTSDGVIAMTLRQMPTRSIDDIGIDLDDPTELSESTNPYYMAENITKDRRRDNVTLRMGLDYQITDKLLFRTTGNYTRYNYEYSTYYPKTVSQGLRQVGRNIQERTSAVKLMNENLLYYNNTFGGKHRLGLMAGMTIETFRDRWLRVENQKFTNENLGANSIGEGINPQIPQSSSDRNAYQMCSFFGRAEYGFDNRYLLTATMRADGSSRFSENNKWGYFPSVAFAWRANEELFLREAKWLSNLKIRLSVGVSGNTAIPSFRTKSVLTVSNMPMDGGTSADYGVVVDRPENNDLKWETTTQYNTGIDFGILANRLTLTADAYIKRTKDLLLERNAPLYSGFSSSWSNIGEVENRGLELTINGIIADKKDFYLNASFNVGFNRSKVISIPGGVMYFDPGVVSGSGNFIIIKEGQPLGQWFGYKTEGVWRSQAEIDALPDDYKAFTQTKAQLRPGDTKFVSTDGNPSITTDDRVVLGNGEPLFTGGFSFNVGYRNFELSTILQFSYGADVFNANLHTLEAGREYYNSTRRLLDAWTPTLYDAATGALVYEGNPNGRYRLPGGVAENYCMSTLIEDGSFLRLSDITLSYTFGRELNWMKKAGISNLKLFVTAKNLHVWTDYYGYDPEVNTRQGNLGDFAPSLDFGSYPRARTVS